MSVEEAFAKLVGRQATEEERARLYRIRDVLGLRDNDAFWSIVMALEYYDSLWRRYPAQLMRETERAIETARGAVALAARKEAAQIERIISVGLAAAGRTPSQHAGAGHVWARDVSLLLAVVTGFGTLCVHAGYRLGTNAAACGWAAAAPRSNGGALNTLLLLPAGWMLFAFLLPSAGYGIRAGWRMARHPLADLQDKIVGWGLAGLCLAGAWACAWVLAAIA